MGGNVSINLIVLGTISRIKMLEIIEIAEEGTCSHEK